MFKNFTILVFSLFLLSSCATIFTGTKDTIGFSTNPQGATVYLNGLEVCKTPCKVNVKRSLLGQDVEIRLKGYNTRVFTLDSEFNVVSVVNLGNLFGWAIDVATGAITKYTRKHYDLDLEESQVLNTIQPSMIDINSKDKTVNLFVYQ